MGLGAHLWQLLCRGPATVEVRFHEPMTLSDGSSRKSLAGACERVVAKGVSEALSGRIARPLPAAPAGQPA